MEFEWHNGKNSLNIAKHGLSFHKAKQVFSDKNRVIILDKKHSVREKRYYCIGKTRDGKIATVRFTIRKGHIRIIGAGYWREGKEVYEQR
ncbi:MAG: BrnT family toxin [Nitrosotalea sp.]